MDIFTDPNVGLLGERQKMFPLIPAAGIAPPPAPKTQNLVMAAQQKTPTIDHIPPRVQNIMGGVQPQVITQRCELAHFRLIEG